MTTPFALAQQAANVAYDMTLEQTGDRAQAADDYKSVMDAYHGKRVIMVQHANGQVEINDAPRTGYIEAQSSQIWGWFSPWMGDDELTAAQKADIEARCAETSNEREDSR